MNIDRDKRGGASRRVRRLLVTGVVPVVITIAASGSALAAPQAGVTTPPVPGQAGVSPRGGQQPGVTPAPDLGAGLAAALPDPPPPRPERPLAKYWADPSWPEPVPDSSSENRLANGQAGEETSPPPELTLHLGTESHPRPDWASESLVREWNRHNDNAVYQVALFGDAIGLPREAADRLPIVTTAGAYGGAAVGADIGAFTGGVVGCFGGMLIGGVAGGIVAGAATGGVGAPLGATVGGIGGCMAGAAIVGVPAWIAGGVIGGAVGATVATAFGAGDSSNPPPPPAPASETALIEAKPIPEILPAPDPIPVAAPAPLDALVSGAVTAAQQWVGQLTNPPVPAPPTEG
ncbi:hypothetical protein AB0C34_18045 [Nocardia sp. NPDC049220]|uniref:hypothetical protein n=1 Tax=Nocardia sp. NPDC049220 TaxID=3155273 RepID=UPI0033EA87F5